MRKVEVVLGLDTVVADVVEESDKTLWVRLANGNVIKRHKAKHLVRELKEGEQDEVDKSSKED